jgi:hypothetical protein
MSSHHFVTTISSCHHTSQWFHLLAETDLSSSYNTLVYFKVQMLIFRTYRTLQEQEWTYFHPFPSTPCHGNVFNRPLRSNGSLRLIISRPVCRGVRRPSGTCGQFFFLLKIYFRRLRFCNFVAPSLTRGWVCNLLYNCFWDLPEQSLLGRSPTQLTAIFYCLIWDSTETGPRIAKSC